MSRSKLTRIGILGGGPAGLSMAKLLSEHKGVEPVVIELADRIGGKSDTITEAGLVGELGTCYATLGHKQTNRWMKQLKIDKYQIGEQRFDGGDFIDYVKRGSGWPLLLQVARYQFLRLRLLKILNNGRATPAQNREAAMPIKDWLDQRGLNKVERFMHRAISSMGYGYVDTTPTVQALRWCDWDLMITGVFNQLYGPKIGWYEFWCRLSEAFDVQVNVRTESITRDAQGVTLHTNDGARRFDYLVTTIAPDEFTALVEPSDEETLVADAMEWMGYSSALVNVRNWFTGWQTEGYSDSILSADRASKMVAVRYEGNFPDLGGDIYFIGHGFDGFSQDEVGEILTAQLAEKGAELVSIIRHRNWKYFPRYRREALENGLLATMHDMQGVNRTFYTGAAYSHEAVSTITRFNQRLLHTKILPFIRRRA